MKKYATDWILKIDDVTTMVQKQYSILEKKGVEELIVARERVYPVNDYKTAQTIGIDKA